MQVEDVDLQPVPPERGPPGRVVVATGNAGKLREIRELLVSCEVEALSQSEWSVPTVEETGLTFVENAILKARNAALHAGLPAIADDSGLEVDALAGLPGVRSSTYAGPHATDGENVEKLLAALEGVEHAARTARFHCLMVYMRHAADPTPVIAHGVWEGLILEEPRGENGFGYDPVFYVPTHGVASAELPPEVKNAISHRGQALRQLWSLLAAMR